MLPAALLVNTRSAMRKMFTVERLVISAEILIVIHYLLARTCLGVWVYIYTRRDRHVYIHTHILIYTYVSVCVCARAWVLKIYVYVYVTRSSEIIKENTLVRWSKISTSQMTHLALLLYHLFISRFHLYDLEDAITNFLTKDTNLAQKT